MPRSSNNTSSAISLACIHIGTLRSPGARSPSLYPCPSHQIFSQSLFIFLTGHKDPCTIVPPRALDWSLRFFICTHRTDWMFTLRLDVLVPPTRCVFFFFFILDVFGSISAPKRFFPPAGDAFRATPSFCYRLSASMDLNLM